MTAQARRSRDLKYIVCGACRGSLARRDRLVRAGMTEAGHYVVWEDGWHVVEDHIEMWATARDRLAIGNKPGRRDWADEARIELSRLLPKYPPAKCPRCGEMNILNPKRLDIQGVAPHT